MPDGALAILADLIARVGAAAGLARVTGEEVASWDPEFLSAIRRAGLLREDRPSSSVVCPGCERACLMPINMQRAADDSTRYFVVCDKRDDVNRVRISTAAVLRWRIDLHTLAAVIGGGIGLGQIRASPGDTVELGLVRGEKRTQLVSLRVNDGVVVLVAGDRTLLVVEVLRFSSGIEVDSGAVVRLVDSSHTSDPFYTPSVVRREARKLDTQQMYGQWRVMYRQLAGEHPDKSDRWIADRIARSEIGHGRSPDTIRRKMKTPR